MKTRLVIDDNTVYEIDEECLNRMKSKQNDSGNHKSSTQNSYNGMKDRNSNNRFNK